MELFDPNKVKFPFVKSYKFFVPFSIALFVICLFLMLAKPGIKYGIDFRGGVEATMAFKDPAIDTGKLRAQLEPKLPGVSIVEVQQTSVADQGFVKEFLVISAAERKEDVTRIFDEAMKDYGVKGQDWTISKLEVVGPKVGGELRKAALWSLIYTALLITLYVYVRFDMRYAPGAMVGVLHDLVFTCGFLVVGGIEFSTNVVAALLTLAGYSINDTVVVFDRIREVEHQAMGRTKEATVDYAINSTLSRTLVTGMSTLLSLMILYLVGGPTLRDFSLTLFVGIIVGTYSSVFVAAPLYLWGDRLWNPTPASKNAAKPTGKMKHAKV